MKKVALIGSSGHSKSVIDVIQQEGALDIVGLIDDYKPVGETTLNIPIIGSTADILDLWQQQKITGVIIAVGDNYTRWLISKKIISDCPSIEFYTTIHPKSTIAAGVCIGKGTVIMAGSIINAESKVGDFCIINTNASVDHDCTISNYSSLAPSVTTGGNCFIGECSSIGIGATLIHQVRVSKHCVIGAGSLVIKNTAPYTLNYGVPAKEIGTRQAADKYL